MHSSNLSTPTSPLIKLTHIASWSLCEPPKNNGLSNFSLLTLLSTHFVKICCITVLFFDTDQNRSISMGKGWSKPEMVVSMPSPVVLDLRSLAFMLFFLYTSKTTSTWLHDLKRNLNLLQRLMKKFYVFRFWFFIDTFLAYAMKSIITFLWWCIGSKCVGIFFCYHTFKFSCQFRIIWLLDQTSFCKTKTCRWDIIAHDNFKIEISQASIVNMTENLTVSLAKSYSFFSLFLSVLFLVLEIVADNRVFHPFFFILF